MTRWLVWLAIAGATPGALVAQDTTAARPQAPAEDTLLVRRPTPTAALTLAEALGEARKSSPAYRQTLNDANPARWGVRSAYGTLLPSFTASAGFGYTGAGEQSFGGTFFTQSSPSYNSDYSLALRWDLNGQNLTAPTQQKAVQRAVSEEIGAAGVALEADVTTQYLDALAATARVLVAEQQVRRNSDFLALARARYEVGQTTLLDVRQAEVIRGTSLVDLLRAVQQENEAKLELFRRMGVVPPVPVEQIALTDSFPVTEPQFDLNGLLTLAEEQNPSLRALRAREHAADAAVRSAKSEYLPSLTLQAGWSGFTQQFTDTDMLLNQQFGSAQQAAADCQFDNQVRTGLGLGGETANCFSASGLTPDGTALDPGLRSSLIDRNDIFPFSYRGQPFQANLRVTLPIFTGFSRSLRVAQARAQQQDADESVRARGLQVRTDVNGRYLAVQTAYRAIPVQEANRRAARDQLQLAEDRYRLGSGTSLEVSDAQSAVQRAESDYITAVYQYHSAIVALEAAVGRHLR